MMTLEEILSSVPLDQWQVGQVYSYDWYDGPRAGGCQLVTPACEFYFELLAERYNPDGLDDRLYRLSALAPGSVAEMQALSRKSLTCQEASRALETLRASRRPTDLIIWTPYMNHFLGLWKVPRTEPDRKDWFTFLNIPAPDSSDYPHGQVA